MKKIIITLFGILFFALGAHAQKYCVIDSKYILEKLPEYTNAQKQLDEYFAGKRTQFSVPFQLQGTSFQKKVYQALLKIPYGKTQSYADIARIIGHDRAYRAVGSANHVNRLPIIIPCHRVIGSKGKLVGFRGGLEIKSWILAHEQQHKKNF